MIWQVLVGALIARKVVKVVKNHKELDELKALGEKLNCPYIPGENVNKYRAKLQKERDFLAKHLTSPSEDLH